jgi:hypothetical protein
LLYASGLRAVPEFHKVVQPIPGLRSGEVNVASFDCTNTDRSSFVERVCYDKPNQYMLINLKGTYYHYCEIDSETVSRSLKAESLGRFYNATIKGRFDCRTHRVPQY